MSLIILSSPNVRRTIAIGRAIGRAAPSGSIIAFRGDLGAGKTTLAKGVAQGLGITEPIISPTFTIIAEYQGRLHLVHIDAYVSWTRTNSCRPAAKSYLVCLAR